MPNAGLPWAWICRDEVATNVLPESREQLMVDVSPIMEA